MKKFFCCTIITLFAQTTWAQSLHKKIGQTPQQFQTSVNVASAGFSAERLKRLDQWIQGAIAADKMPNLVMLVARNGNIVYHKAFGYSNKEEQKAATTSDIFRIASQTKAIASVALMTLYEEGKFMLDDPISKYIPAFANPQVLQSYDTLHPDTGKFTTRPAKSEITIRHLLSHSAGIPYDHPLENRPEFKVPYLSSMHPDKLEDVINKLAKRPLVADPGQGFVYGLNTDVVGHLIEVLTGQPLDVAIRQRVTGPLGMNDTYFYLPQEKAQRLVALYSKGKAAEAITVSANDTLRMYPVAGAKTYFSAGAGMVSTALDYAKFCQMLLNGGTFNNQRILAPHTIALMTQNQIGAAEVWDRRDKFGLGFQIFTEQSRYGDLAAPGAYSWGGAYCSEYTIDPANGLVIQFFTNVLPFVHYTELTRTLRVLVYQAME